MALGFGMAITTFGLSLRFKAPVITAWSTPGAALLATSLTDVSMPEAIGAFLFSALLITVFGVTGWFEKVIDRIPLSIAAAMLAGILFQFGVDIFHSMESRFSLVAGMFVVYLLARRLIPRYAIIIVLILGLSICQMQSLIQFNDFQFAFTAPVFIYPEFSLSVLIGVGIPLFVVTMVSQNIPGIAVLRAAGYQTPISPLISWTGLTTLVLAPFGGFAINLAAITAAICTGREAHEDPKQRYLAGLSTGVFYFILGLCGAAVAGLFAVFPGEFVLALAGLALIGTIGASMHTAMAEDQYREAAIITFLVTASGVTLFGVGAAFWGLLCGVIALLILEYRK